MKTKQLKTDYLIIGSGAVGMAFADTLLTDSKADIIMVDNRSQAGGHWNDAYPFVTLHQPSAFYGVSSRPLGHGNLDAIGLNKGLGNLAAGAEVAAYFNAVMKERFLPSGRVRYFPMHQWLGANKIQSILTGEVIEIEVGNKTVEATYLKSTIPATHTPNFTVEEGVWFAPLNALAKLNRKPKSFTIIGGGKTGIDACLFLLENQVNPDRISWIMPRDAWLVDRINTQPTIEFFNQTIGAQAAQFEAIAASTSMDDLFDRLEAAGVLLRIDKSVKPEMFHAATISQAELKELRRIKNIIRLGRVTHLGRKTINMQKGDIATDHETFHVDCSASAISNLKPRPIFEGNWIYPQTVRSYQPTFSASFIAHIEATRETEKEKNQLCGVVPLPNKASDWITVMIPFMLNQYQWSRDPELRQWMQENRLDGFAAMVKNIPEEDREKRAIIKRLRDASMPAMAKLQTYQSELQKAESENAA